MLACKLMLISMIIKASFCAENQEGSKYLDISHNLNWRIDSDKVEIIWPTFINASFYELKITHYTKEPTIITTKLIDTNYIHECGELDRFVSYRLNVNFKDSNSLELSPVYLDCQTMKGSSDNGSLNKYLNELRAQEYSKYKSKQMSRSLTGNTSASKSTISYSSNVVAFTSYTVTVTARDSSGNLRGVGNDIFWIKIENQCSKATEFYCYDVSNQRKVLQTEIDAQMTDNLDGTYTYTYSTDLDGTISVSVLLYTEYGVYAEYFNNIVYTGTVANYATPSQMSLNFGAGLVTSTQGDNVSANFYFKLQPLKSDTYTLYLLKDDYAIVYVEGVSKASGTGGTHSFTQFLNMNQFYTIKISWIEYGGIASVELDWSYTGQAQIAIPSQNLYYPAYVASSPLNVVATCPFGYTGYNSSSPTRCKEICGDGYRIGVEECDDKNTNSNDGCSSTCTIESGWVCFDGSSSSQDTCRWCIAGFQQNSSKNDCIVSEYSTSIKNFTISFGCLLFFCIIVNIVESIAMKFHSIGIYCMIEQIQIISLLSIIYNFYPVEIMQFFRMMRVLLMEFNFIGVENAVFRNYKSDDQPVQNLQNLGFDYVSGPINIFDNICFLFILLVFHSICYIIFEKSIPLKGNLNKFQKALKYISNWMKISMYIRYFALSYVLYLVAFLSEMNYSNFKNQKKWSIIISLILIIFIGMLITFPLWYWYLKFRNRKTSYKMFYKELFRFVKKNTIARLYPIIFFLRRCVLCIIVCLNFDTSYQFILSLFVSFEGLHLLFLLFTMPFRMIKDNFLAIFNGLLMIFYSVSCYFYKDMGYTFTWAYLWVIMINMLIIFIVSLIVTGLCITKNLVQNENKAGHKRSNAMADLKEESKGDDQSQINLHKEVIHVKKNSTSPKRERIIKRPAELFPEDIKLGSTLNNEVNDNITVIKEQTPFIKNPSSVYTQRPRPKSPVSMSLS